MSGEEITDVDFVGVEKRRIPSKHYVYIIRIMRSGGIKYIIYRRYSHFIRFERRISKLSTRDSDGSESTNGGVLPFLNNSDKIFLGRSHVRRTAERRTVFLQEYCKKLIKAPACISRSSVVLDFFTATADDAIAAAQERISPEKVDEIQDISVPIEPQEYRVLSDYTATVKQTISLVSGAIVQVISKSDIGWWFVKSGEKQGWAPSSHLNNVLGGEDEDDVKILYAGKPYICTKPYTSQESDEMSLVVGMLVKVREKRMDGWWLVQYGGHEAIVPGCCLAPINSMKARRLMKILPDQKSPDLHLAIAPSRDRALDAIDSDRNWITINDDTVHWCRTSPSESSDEDQPTSPDQIQAIPRRSAKRPTGTSRIAQIFNARAGGKNGNKTSIEAGPTSATSPNKPVGPLSPAGRENAVKLQSRSSSSSVATRTFGGATNQMCRNKNYCGAKNPVRTNKQFESVNALLSRQTSRPTSAESDEKLPMTGQNRPNGFVSKMVSEIVSRQTVQTVPQTTNRYLGLATKHTCYSLTKS